MSNDSIDAVSQSLSSLTTNLAANQKILEKGSSSILQWSDATSKAGRNWTTFSRLTSGTGIWKLQNYIRGTLEVIGKFSESTKKQIKEQTESEKKLADTVKGVKKVNEEYADLQKTFTNQEKLAKRLQKHDRNEQIQLKTRLKLIDKAEKKDKILIATKKGLLDSLNALEGVKKDILVYEKEEAKVGKLSIENARHLSEMQEKYNLGMSALSNSKKEYTAALEKASSKEIQSVEAIKEKYKARRKQHEQLAELTDQQKEALESTNAYNQAIITGKSDTEAYAASFTQLSDNVKQNQDTFDAYKEKMTEALKVKEAFDAGAQSPEFAILKKGVEGQREELKGERKSESKEFRGKVKGGVVATGKGALKGTVGLFKNLNPKILLKNLKKTAKFTKESFKKIRNSNTMLKLAVKLQMKAIAFQKFMKPVLNMAFKFLIFGILGMIALLAIAKVAYDIMGIMSEFGVFDDMKEIFLAAVDILTSVFGIIGSFMEGDFASMFDYLGTIMSSLMTIGWNLLQIFVKGIFAIAVGIFYSIIDMMIWLVDGGWKVALPALIKIGVTLLGLYFVKYLIMQGLFLIGIYALPIIVIGLAAALLYAVVKHLYNHFAPVKSAIDWGVGIFSSFWSWITALWNDTKGTINDFLSWFGVDPLAKGGMTHGNTNLVGELGPERVKLPAGSRVYSNSQSKSMSGGSTVINTNITINAKDTSDAELRRIADKIGGMVNNKINRTTSSRTFG